MDHKTEKSIVWITGASSGLGLALTKRYLDAGWKVFASARKPRDITALLGLHHDLIFVPYDIADASLVTDMKETMKSLTPHLDCVILNAGTCEYLEINNIDWGMMERMMTVNFLGLVNCVNVCLPLLKKSTKPHLVGISSQAAQAAFPKAEAYGASKAAIRYLLSSLRMDLKQFNIDVTCLLPGFIDTPLTQKNTFPMPFLMTADDAAQRIYHALRSRPYEYAFPKRLSALLWFGRCLPKLWVSMLAPKK